MYEAATGDTKGYEAATRSVMWVQSNYKRCEAGMRQLQRGTVGMRWLQVVQSRYKATTRGER